MFGLQPLHLVLILIIALVIFGPSRLPELGRSLGKSITEFKNATHEMTDPLQQAVDPAKDVRQEPAAVRQEPVVIRQSQEPPAVRQEPSGDAAQK